MVTGELTCVAGVKGVGWGRGKSRNAKEKGKERGGTGAGEGVLFRRNF